MFKAVKILNDFQHHMLHGNVKDKRKTRGIYYRALLIDPRVKRAKFLLQKGEISAFNLNMETLKVTYETNEVKRNVMAEITLKNIMQFHLNNFMGLPNTSQTLENIHTELQSVADDIFGSGFLKIHVERSKDGKFIVSYKE